MEAKMANQFGDKSIYVEELYSHGWTHKVEIEDGVRKLFEWYKESLAR